MKGCKKARELLTTDYLDGCACQEDKLYVDKHLEQCRECGSLRGALEAQRATFKKAGRKDVPERLWQNIRDAVIAQRPEEPVASLGFLERLKGLIPAPRPVFALSSVFTVVILIVVMTNAFVRNKELAGKASAAEGLVGYSFTLNGENDDLFFGLGTDMEEYFL